MFYSTGSVICYLASKETDNTLSESIFIFMINIFGQASEMPTISEHEEEHKLVEKHSIIDLLILCSRGLQGPDNPYKKNSVS